MKKSAIVIWYNFILYYYIKLYNKNYNENSIIIKFNLL